METQLQFLLSFVKFGSQKWYQAWFANKFLLRPGEETVVVDIVRFICCSHHPSNEVIHSDIIIGWLLTCCRKSYFEAVAKLALFYDWLFFDERVDNAMNIEPAMPLMVYSMPKYMNLTHLLLEFLLLLVDNYDVDHKSIIVRGVSSAFGKLVQKGVACSLDVLTCCDALSPFLRERLQNFLLGSNMGAAKDLQPVGVQAHPMPLLSLLDMSRRVTPAASRKRKLQARGEMD